MSFIKYNNEDSVASSETSVKGLWSNDMYQLTTFFTSSIVSSSYYLSVFNSSSLTLNQFDIEYGNQLGTGSLPINTNIPENTPTRIIYGQYRNLIYGDESSSFNFGGTVSNDFWIININRNLYRESLKPGSFNLTLSSGSNSISLTDNSNVIANTQFIGTNKYYTIISGSNGNQSPSALANPSGSYGFLFPDMGIILLNPKSLNVSPSNGGISLNTGSNANSTLFNAISRSANFTLQSQETLSSRIFFTRIKNAEHNYTTNPSIIDNNGNIIYSTLIYNPQTFITTIGMYNDNNELLAVAKLNKPLKKDFASELLLTIKLGF